MECKNSMEGLGQCCAAAVSRTASKSGVWPEESMGLLALNRAPGAVAGDE